MKIRNLLTVLATAMAVFASSCSKNPDTPGPEPDKIPKEKAYFSFKLTGGPETRAVTDANATVADLAVDGACILMFGTSGSRELLYKELLSVTNLNVAGDDIVPYRNSTASEHLATSGDAESPSEESFVSKALQVDKQDYSMVVLLNVPAALSASLVTKAEADASGGVKTATTLASFKAARENVTLTGYGLLVGSGPGYTKIFMSNSQGEISVSEGDLQGSPEDAEETPSGVDVMRMFAKINVIKGAGFSVTQDGSALTGATWKLDVVNRKSYLMRMPFGTEGVNHQNWYATDPNMTVSGYDESELETEEFIYVSSLFADGHDFTGSPGNFQFTFENTMVAAEQVPGKIEKVGTRIVLCAQIKPATLTTADNYYSFNGCTFTQDQANSWAVDDNFPPEVDGLQAVVSAINSEYGAGTITFGVGGQEPSTYFSSRGLTFHKDQMNIYYIPIKHFGNDPGASIDDAGYYGVVRNNVYEVTINSIKGPGPAPEDYSFVSSSVRILPWAFRQQAESEVPGI